MQRTGIQCAVAAVEFVCSAELGPDRVRQINVNSGAVWRTGSSTRLSKTSLIRQGENRS
jgi:hypothetical protein